MIPEEELRKIDWKSVLEKLRGERSLKEIIDYYHKTSSYVDYPVAHYDTKKNAAEVSEIEAEIDAIDSETKMGVRIRQFYEIFKKHYRDEAFIVREFDNFTRNESVDQAKFQCIYDMMEEVSKKECGLFGLHHKPGILHVINVREETLLKGMCDYFIRTKFQGKESDSFSLFSSDFHSKVEKYSGPRTDSPVNYKFIGLIDAITQTLWYVERTVDDFWQINQ